MEEDCPPVTSAPAKAKGKRSEKGVKKLAAGGADDGATHSKEEKGVEDADSKCVMSMEPAVELCTSIVCVLCVRACVRV